MDIILKKVFLLCIVLICVPLFFSTNIWVYWTYEPWINQAISSVKWTSKTVSQHGFILNNITVRNHIFVQGVSSNHYQESTQAIQGIQRHFPSADIHIFNLGLNSRQYREVETWCRVKLHNFNFSKYPGHVRNLRTYAFKIIILKEMLKKHDAVFWVDASIRIRSNDLETAYAKIINNDGMLMLISGNADSAAFTDPHMMQWLNMTDVSMKNVTMFGGGALMMYNTETVQQRILDPLYKCAINRECIAPSTSTRKCNSRRLHCHRQDQSALSVILYNYYRNISIYSGQELEKSRKVFVYRRGRDSRYPISYCKLNRR